jgi:hypothetical protein
LCFDIASVLTPDWVYTAAPGFIPYWVYVGVSGFPPRLCFTRNIWFHSWVCFVVASGFTVKYTRHLQTDNITLLMYKPFIWEIILCETLNYAMTYPPFESFWMYGFIHVPQMN